jgi:hypothetical protein
MTTLHGGVNSAQNRLMAEPVGYANGKLVAIVKSLNTKSLRFREKLRCNSGAICTLTVLESAGLYAPPKSEIDFGNFFALLAIILWKCLG